MRQHQGNRQVDAQFEPFSPGPIPRERPLVAFFTNVLFALDEALDGSKHKLQIDRLRARPAAPDATEERRAHDDDQHHAHTEQEQEQRVGRVKREAKEGEFTVHEVQQHGRLPPDVNHG